MSERAPDTMIPGLVVAERYRLDRKLGEGGMGAVWAATHVVTRKMVAIKLLKPELAKNASLVERFLREARAACAVRHPHVVQIHDVLQMAEGSPVMVMDLLEGESLAERLERDGRIPVPDFSRIMMQVLSAVSAAHAAHVVHRDLKPDNIFLASTPDGSLDVKILDFGIAKVAATDAEAGVLTKTGSMLGTPFYMSPEQLFGEKDVDQRSDVWALGIIAYECLTGKRPTEADNLGQIIKLVTTTGIAPLESVAPHVPPDLCAVVRAMLTSNRAQRIAELARVRDVFARYTGAPGTYPPPSTGASPPLGSTPPGYPSSPVPAAGDAPTASGPLPWAAATQPTQPEQPAAKSPKRWLAVAAGGVLLAALSGGAIVVPRMRAASAPAPSGVASTTPVSKAFAATDGTMPPPEPSAVPLVSSSPPPPASASAASPASLAPRASANRNGAPRPSSSPSSHPPVNTAPTSTTPQGMLVDKPPF